MAEHTREQPIVTPAPQCRRVLRMKPETLAFAAALLGIIAAAPSAIPAISMVGLVPALLALAAGIAAMRLRTTRPGFAIAGVTLGALSVVVAISTSMSAG